MYLQIEGLLNFVFLKVIKHNFHQISLRIYGIHYQYINATEQSLFLFPRERPSDLNP